ncbi:MAG: hypothetical protein RLZZ30_1146 [Bacteroidota bacterium]|jgi:membrane-bound lytic murein transglycosylase F
MRLTWTTLLIALVLVSCSDKQHAPTVHIDLKEIQKKGKLTILTENSSLSFFEYRGKRLGFEYEIMDTFCKSMGLKMEVKVISDTKDFQKFLNNGEGDVISSNLVVSLSDEHKMAYSTPYYYTHQVLVQRTGDSLIKEPAELANQSVYVRNNSPFSSRLTALQEEIGSHIHIRYKKDNPITEDLIDMVANNVIPYTVAHENLARICKEMHPNLNIETQMSFQQKIAFGLRLNSPELKKKLDAFIESYCASPAYKDLKKRYFDYLNVAPVEFYITKKGHLSPFDDVFKSVAKKYGWDWKVLAAVAFKESRFNPNARGFGGAYGMMQFMPNTGPSCGVFPGSAPEVQILGGMKLLNRTYNRWKAVPDQEQRLKFTLASYNAGPCHIEDAQNLARAAGLNPLIWDGNVEEMVRHLDEPKYYRSEHVRCGAYRGHAVTYVKKVFAIYSAWK